MRVCASWRTSTLGWKNRPASTTSGNTAIAAAIKPIGVATGENRANRVLFKQLVGARSVSARSTAAGSAAST